METSLKTGFAQIFYCRSKHPRAIINNEHMFSIQMAQSIPTVITTNFHLNLIQLWWQLLISNVCLWRRSLRSNLASIDPEKLYRATFICQFGPCCCIIWPLFLFDWAIGLPPTLGTRGFSRVRRESSVLAEGRHIFGSRPKPRVAKLREKPLARSVAFYRPR